MRIEDLDGPRVKAEASQRAIELLEWIGLNWDEGPIYQSHDLAPYRAAMTTLARSAMAYPCELTRAQIEAAASAPQEGAESHEIRFPPELRPELRSREFEDAETNWRFVTPERIVEFCDEVAGAQRHEPARTIGDFVLWTKRGVPAYQLAVVVDDSRQGVTHVVRGDDLLDSAARQMLLYGAMGEGNRVPRYAHLPLVVGPDGRRLAKRHGDTRIDHYRSLGMSRERLIGLLMAWSGVGERHAAREMTLDEAVARFDLGTMPREQIVFGPEDEAWLTWR